MPDATLEPRWGEVTHTFAEVRIRSGLSVPVRLEGRPIGTLDVYAAAPGGWDETEVSALQAYAGVVAALLGAAARATVKSRLAEQLQAALDASARRAGKVAHRQWGWAWAATAGHGAWDGGPRIPGAEAGPDGGIGHR